MNIYIYANLFVNLNLETQTAESENFIRGKTRYLILA